MYAICIHNYKYKMLYECYTIEIKLRKRLMKTISCSY